MTKLASCPRCNRLVGSKGGRFRSHTDGKSTCPLEYQWVPAEGMSDESFELRAKIVTDLAMQVQDADPHVVFEYLTATAAEELQLLLMTALAAVPLNRSLSDMFRWVTDLPVAQQVSA